MFDLGLMLLFLIEHTFVSCNPNGPKGNAMEAVPNLNFLGKFLRDPFHKKRFVSSGSYHSYQSSPDPT